MQKVYIVLKNNRQEGPYTLQELKQMALKATDLIWVEGSSAAWCFPSEIKELQSSGQGYAQSGASTKQSGTTDNGSSTHIKSSKNVFVSLPGGSQKSALEEITPVTNLEEKAEALRQKIMAHQATAPKTHEDTVETKLQRYIEDVAGDFGNWALYQQAKKKKVYHRKKYMAAAVAVMIICLVAGYFLFPNSENASVISEREHQPTYSQKEIGTEHAITAVEPQATNPLLQTDAAVKGQITNKAATPDINLPQKRSAPETLLHQEAQQQPVIINTAEPIIVEEKAVTEIKEESTKKKSIGEAIDGFFDKLKTKNNEAENGTASKSDDERKSTKRDDDKAASALELVDVTGQVKVTTNAPRDNWMLGVKGQKITLQNNSKFVIENAVVSVEYYSEDETLLDTKKIEFNNIKPSRKVTVPLPDHRMASYTTQQVLMANGTQ